MATYSTYPFYTDTWHGTLDEDTYNRYAVRAKAIIDSYTMGRAAVAPESAKESLAFAECEIIDALNSFNTVESSGGITGVTSVNNDGYSISLSSTAAADQKTKLWEILNLWLGQTGMLSRAVRVKNIQRPNWRYWGWKDACRW